jgi:hypothetical protein
LGQPEGLCHNRLDGAGLKQRDPAKGLEIAAVIKNRYVFGENVGEAVRANRLRRDCHVVLITLFYVQAYVRAF